jgi:hypothetical protein
MVLFEADLLPDEHAAVYVESSGDVFPLSPGERGVLVPSGTAIVPFFLRAGVVTVAPRQVAGDSFSPVVRPKPAAGMTGVVVAVVGDQEALKKARGGPSTPTLTLQASDRRSEAINKLDPAYAGGQALGFFNAVPNGAGTAALRGSDWRDDEVKVTNGRGERPLQLIPSSALTVRWSTPETAALTHVQHPTCPAVDSSFRNDAPTALTVARCPSEAEANDAWRIDAHLRSGASQCVATRSVQIGDRTSGQEVIRDAKPGVYLVTLRIAGLPATNEVVTLDGSDRLVDITLTVDRWFGTVRRDGKPLSALVRIGAGAVSDGDTGEYLAYSAPLPPVAPSVSQRFFKDPGAISIQPCNGGAEIMFVPEKTPLANARLDIDIVSTELNVSVIDERSGVGIADAEVSFSVMRLDDATITLFEGATEATKGDGTTKLVDLPTNRDVIVCASHKDYRKACAARTILDTTTKSISIALRSATGHEGVVRYPGVRSGRVVWVSPSGEETESANIKPDGSFSYSGQHAPGEPAFVVSPTAPLLSFRQPTVEGDQPLEVTYPAPPRSFRVSLSSSAREPKGFLGMVLDGVIVPMHLLSEHLLARGARPVFLAPTTIAVPDIGVTNSVSFMFAPLTWAGAQSGGRSADFFYLPAGSALRRAEPDAWGLAVVGH